MKNWTQIKLRAFAGFPQPVKPQEKWKHLVMTGLAEAQPAKQSVYHLYLLQQADFSIHQARGGGSPTVSCDTACFVRVFFVCKSTSESALEV